MHREVFRYVEDGFEDVDIVALDFSILEQGCGIDGLESRFDVSERRTEQGDQFVARDHVALFEFRIAIALVRGGTNTTYNLLPRIAAEVQDQVADAVRFFVCAPPDLLVAQLLETALDLG